MSWWNKWLGRRPAERADDGADEWADDGSFSTELEIIPDALTVRIVLHRIDTPQGVRSCWSYVTDGLMSHQQKEIVFTLRRKRGEPKDGFPHVPLDVLRMIYHVAEEGRLVEVGGHSEFGGKALFGRHLLYARAEPLADVALPASCLAALLVTTEELHAARAFGATRVFARLGHAACYYPVPPWADRDRAGLSFRRTTAKSVLSKLPRVPSGGGWATRSGPQITINLPRSTLGAWDLPQLSESMPFAILTHLEPVADSCLVWQPGQLEAEAIAPKGSPGALLGGCFVAVLPEQAENGGIVLEDGFLMKLTSVAAAEVWRALRAGDDLTIPATGDGMALALRWRDALEVPRMVRAHDA